METNPQAEPVEVRGSRAAPTEVWTGHHDDRSIRDLMRDLSHDSTLLVHQEAELFKREIEGRVSRLEKHATVLGGGGVIAHIGVLSLTAALILLLSLVMAAWGAALLVGAVYVAVGAVTALAGKRQLKHDSVKPEQSIESVKRDVHTVQEAVR